MEIELNNLTIALPIVLLVLLVWYTIKLSLYYNKWKEKDQQIDDTILKIDMEISNIKIQLKANQQDNKKDHKLILHKIKK